MKKAILLLCLFCTIVQAYAWKPVFAGHRGSLRGVENTIEAFMNGIEHYGYTGLEIDVKTTKDGEYVCWHDDDLKRVGHDVSIPNSNFADIKYLPLTQTRDGVQYTAVLCTVDRFLSICKENNVFPIIELKWATGINSNDMSRFPGLYALIEKHGLVEEARILTSMQPSLEYVRTNYPQLQCQYLCYEVTESRYQWCLQWGVNPSVQTGGLTKEMARKCHDAGMEVACWTVNSESNYKKHGELGCTTMTCDYLVPAKMPELEEIDWDILAPIQPLDSLYITPIFNYTKTAGTLPENFPTTIGGSYTQAQEAVYIDGVYYAADYFNKKIVAIDTTGNVYDSGIAAVHHGICRDDAGNLLLHTSPEGASKPKQLTVYRAEDNTEHVIDIVLNHTGQTNFPTASGDIFSEEGGYVYFFPNKHKYVEVVKIVNGKFVNTTSQAVSLEADTASYVIPIDNNPAHFIYQVGGNGYYLYKGTDKGDYMTTPDGTTAPARNNSIGGAFFRLGGHDMFVYSSGSNYNGGWTIRDMTSTELTPMFTQEPLGNDGYNGNASAGAFFYWEQLDEKTINLYEYCLGSGIAGWEISTEPHRIRPKKLTLNESEITIVIGDTAYLEATITPANVNNIEIDWALSPILRTNKIVEIDNTHIGVVIKRADTYVLTATLEHLTAECILHVTDEPTDVQEIILTTDKPYIFIQNGHLYIKYQNSNYDITGKRF